jgi:acetate kinase
MHEFKQTPAASGTPLTVLALNTGSSSLKFGLYQAAPDGMKCLLDGEAEGFGKATASFHATDAQGVRLWSDTRTMANAGDAVVRIDQLLAKHDAPLPDAIGHRIVHGGPRLRAHGLIDAQVMKELEAAAAFAPLHTPQALAVVRYAKAHFPGLPQVACLDTCFHATMPPVASTLPLPRDLRAAGIQRYGFHGLSCESIVRQLGAKVPKRLVIAHLGNGASITAVHQGRSIDTSMGLTPTGGLIMGTRSGDLDPGVLVHLMREMKMDATAVEDLVDHHCGLLGLSGVSGDMRSLHDAAPSSGEVRLAIDVFCYRVAKELGAMGIALGGVDQIVFTGGIGEHDAQVRAKVCTRLASLGVELDEVRNQQGLGLVSRDASRCSVQVLPSLEDEQIARHTWALCGMNPSPLRAPQTDRGSTASAQL